MLHFNCLLKNKLKREATNFQNVAMTKNSVPENTLTLYEQSLLLLMPLLFLNLKTLQGSFLKVFLLGYCHYRFYLALSV